MKTSKGILALIASTAVVAAVVPVVNYFEPAPLIGGVSVAYQDSHSRTSPWTICDGHTRGVGRGDTATPEQCAEYAAADITDAATLVLQCIPNLTDRDQIHALTDVAYNLGSKVVCGSTLQRKGLSGDWFGMCMQLTDAQGADGMPNGWTLGGGVRLKGLVLRRIYDRDWCLGHQHKGFP